MAAEAKKRSAIITPGTGEELEAILAEQMGASEELIAAMRKAIDTSGACEKNRKICGRTIKLVRPYVFFST